MRPDVEGLIGHLKKAEEAGSGGTLWVSVAEEDALLMEHLQGEEKGTLRLHTRVAGRSQGKVPGSIHLSPRLGTCPLDPGTPDPGSLICHTASRLLPMVSKILCPPRSLQSARGADSRPRLPLGIQPVCPFPEALTSVMNVA